MNYEQGRKLLKILEEGKPDFDQVSILIKKTETKGRMFDENMNTIKSGEIIKKKRTFHAFLRFYFCL